MLAEKAKCNDDIICSCLLHDYGHFIIDDPDDLVKESKDGEHESIGYEYLKKFFNKEDLNKMDFSKKITNVDVGKQSFIYKTLSGVRAKINDPLGKKRGSLIGK